MWRHCECDDSCVLPGLCSLAKVGSDSSMDLPTPDGEYDAAESEKSTKDSLFIAAESFNMIQYLAIIERSYNN